MPRAAVHAFHTLAVYIGADRLRPPETRVHRLFRESTLCAPAMPPEAARTVAIATADMPGDGASGMPVPGGADHALCSEGRTDPVDAMAAGIRRGSRHRGARPPVARTARRFRGGGMDFKRRSDRWARNLPRRRTAPGGGGPRGRLSALMKCFEAARPMG